RVARMPSLPATLHVIVEAISEDSVEPNGEESNASAGRSRTYPGPRQDCEGKRRGAGRNNPRCLPEVDPEAAGGGVGPRMPRRLHEDSGGSGASGILRSSGG